MEPGIVNIRKDYSDVASVLEYSYCFVSVCSFNDPEARVFDHFQSTQTNQWFIFNDEHRRYFRTVSPSRSVSSGSYYQIG
jgi:hypothetical protein